MSGCGFQTYCPNCGSNDAEAYQDWKPYEYTEISCLNCGFYTTTKIGFMRLEELNELREQNSLDKLDVLPEQLF